jgi:CRP-like cAMP-binding protein
MMHSNTLLYEDLLGDLPADIREALQAIEVTRSYPADAQLFAAGEVASGMFVIRRGSVNLSESATEGTVLGSRIAALGEILGVAATVSGDRHQVEAPTIAPSEIGFIDREHLMYFLRTHGAAAFRLVQLLSHTLDAALERARLLPPFTEV